MYKLKDRKLRSDILPLWIYVSHMWYFLLLKNCLLDPGPGLAWAGHAFDDGGGLDFISFLPKTAPGCWWCEAAVCGQSSCCLEDEPLRTGTVHSPLRVPSTSVSDGQWMGSQHLPLLLHHFIGNCPRVSARPGKRLIKICCPQKGRSPPEGSMGLSTKRVTCHLVTGKKHKNELSWMMSNSVPTRRHHLFHLRNTFVEFCSSSSNLANLC